MTPQFKALLLLAALTLIFFGLSGLAYGDDVKWKLCFAETKPDGEIGCYNGVKAVSFAKWLKKIDPTLSFVRAEALSGKIIKVYYK